MPDRDETLRALVEKWKAEALRLEDAASMLTNREARRDLIRCAEREECAKQLAAALAAPTEAAGVDAANTLPPTTCARLAELVAEYGAARKDDESPPVYNRRLTFAMKLSDILALAAQE